MSAHPGYGPRPCRYGFDCFRGDCWFAHPDGRAIDEPAAPMPVPQPKPVDPARRSSALQGTTAKKAPRAKANKKGKRPVFKPTGPNVLDKLPDDVLVYHVLPRLRPHELMAMSKLSRRLHKLSFRAFAALDNNTSPFITLTCSPRGKKAALVRAATQLMDAVPAKAGRWAWQYICGLIAVDFLDHSIYGFPGSRSPRPKVHKFADDVVPLLLERVTAADVELADEMMSLYSKERALLVKRIAPSMHKIKTNKDQKISELAAPLARLIGRTSVGFIDDDLAFEAVGTAMLTRNKEIIKHMIPAMRVHMEHADPEVVAELGEPYPVEDKMGQFMITYTLNDDEFLLNVVRATFPEIAIGKDAEPFKTRDLTEKEEDYAFYMANVVAARLIMGTQETWIARAIFPCSIVAFLALLRQLVADGHLHHNQDRWPLLRAELIDHAAQFGMVASVEKSLDAPGNPKSTMLTGPSFVPMSLSSATGRRRHRLLVFAGPGLGFA